MSKLNVWWGGAGDYDGWMEDMEDYYKTISTQDLIDITEDSGYVDHIPTVVYELYHREPNKALELAKDILEHKKGEEYLQAFIARFMLDHDYDREYVVKFLKNNDDVRDIYHRCSVR